MDMPSRSDSADGGMSRARLSRAAFLPARGLIPVRERTVQCGRGQVAAGAVAVEQPDALRRRECRTGVHQLPDERADSAGALGLL